MTGPGGVGKTRLALAVAHHPGLHTRDIRWCDLAALTAVGQALAAIGQQYGIGDVSKLGPLLRAFAPQPTLLILDNAEPFPDLAAHLPCCSPRCRSCACSSPAARRSACASCWRRRSTSG